MSSEVSVHLMTAKRETRRQKQAKATRQDILEAARSLFRERGYSATSMVAIAETAGTAVQTIYDSVGSKSAILMALLDVMDQQAGVAEAIRQAEATDDPKTLLAIGVHLTRQINESCGDVIALLIHASAIEPAAVEAVADGRRRHVAGTTGWAKMLMQKGALRSGVDAVYAGQAMSVMTSSTVWDELTREHGMTFDESEAWILDTLAKLLLTAS